MVSFRPSDENDNNIVVSRKKEGLMTSSPSEKLPFVVIHGRVIGLLILLTIPLSISTQSIFSHLIVPEDIATTAQNILASEWLFRLGIVGSLLISIADAIIVFAFYRLLKPVDQNLAFLMVMLNLLGVSIAMLNELNQFAILFLLHHSAGLTIEQMQTLVSLFQNMHLTGSFIAGIFWGLWLVPYGMLVWISRLFPRFIGILLMIECSGFLIQSFGGFLWPHLNAVLSFFPAITSWAELFVPLWLVIKGINMTEWKKWAEF
jgi:Domain of unknown function (DUF4386)